MADLAALPWWLNTPPAHHFSCSDSAFKAAAAKQLALASDLPRSFHLFAVAGDTRNVVQVVHGWADLLRGSGLNFSVKSNCAIEITPKEATCHQDKSSCASTFILVRRINDHRRYIGVEFSSCIIFGNCVKLAETEEIAFKRILVRARAGDNPYFGIATW